MTVRASIRIDVVPAPGDLAGADLSRSVALVIDVLRASTTITTAVAHGCRAIVPVVSEAEAHAVRARLGRDALLAGERGGDPIKGFDLGNSPLEFTADRVKDRTIVFTTTNGTRALVAASGAERLGVAAFVNLRVSAAWALGAGRDVVLVCAGKEGGIALEDYVCAGALAAHLAERAPGAVPSDTARAAMEAARPYRDRPGDLREACPWAHTLVAAGRGEDVDVCLALDTVEALAVFDPATRALTRATGSPS